MSDRLTPEREAEIAARAEAATPGPWGFYDGDTYADVAADLQITGRGSYSYREKVARLEDENYWDDAAHEEDDEERASEQMAANAAFIANARQDVPALLAELAAVRAERDVYRERALDAENRSIVDGREVCADCGKPVFDGPCGVHSPDAVFQRGAQEAARLRAERGQARAELDAEKAAHRFTLRQRNNRSNRIMHLRDLANAAACSPTAVNALITAARDTLAASVDDHTECGGESQ